MPFKRVHVPGGLKQQRRVDKLRRAVRLAREERAAREAGQVGGAQSAPVGIQRSTVPDVVVSDVQMSQAEGSADSAGPAVRPITAEDLVAVITGVLQAQQAQQPPPLPPPPPPPPPAPVVRTAASIITDFVRIAPPTFSGEGDPILAEK